MDKPQRNQHSFSVLSDSLPPQLDQRLLIERILPHPQRLNPGLLAIVVCFIIARIFQLVLPARCTNDLLVNWKVESKREYLV